MGSGKPSIVFFGTSEICLPFLEALGSEFSIALIVTQPDSFGGRKRKRLEPPVKIFAREQGISCIQPEKLTTETADRIRGCSPVIGVVISYGKFIPGKIFRIPEFNMVNVHFSLLPQFRGAAPYQRAIEAGMKTTGITVFEIAREMDAGDIWSAMEFSIDPHDTSATLSERMGSEGAGFLVQTLKSIQSGRIRKEPQDDSLATYAGSISKEEGRILWSQSAEIIYNKFRAFTPWPGIFFHTGGKKISVKQMKVSEDPQESVPGRVLSVSREGLRVACGGNSAVDILSILPQGKKEMTPHTYSLGNQMGNDLD